MLKFKFIHITPELIKDGKCAGERCGTHCAIIQEDGTTLGLGDTYVHPSDNFSRPLGRKIAAGRAIRSYIPRLGRRDTFGADKRRQIWEQLFLQSPKTFSGSGRR